MAGNLLALAGSITSILTVRPRRSGRRPEGVIYCFNVMHRFSMV